MSGRLYIVAIVLLLSILAGKLLLTPVQDPPVESSWMSYERARGWPWPYSRSAKGTNPETSITTNWQPVSFSYALLLADVAALLAMLAAVSLFLRRRVRRHGRLWQFSLAEMLALFAVAAVACGWASLQYRQWQREQHVLAHLSDELCETRAEYRGPEWIRRLWPADRLLVFIRVVEVTVTDTRPIDESAASLVGALPDMPYVHSLILHASLASHLTDPAPFSDIDEVYFFSDGTTDRVDDGLVAISTWPSLRRLTIEVDDKSTFSDRGLAALGRSATLEDLTVAEGQLPQVTDAGIAALARAPRLNSLTLPETELTDAAMKLLADAPALKYLSIMTMHKLTDAGVHYLADSKTLRGISLASLHWVSDDALESLARSGKEVHVGLPNGTWRHITKP
jgi:hypothetical protein